MTKVNEVLNARYSTNYRIIYDGNTQMTLEEVVKRLNKQDERIQKLESRLSIATQLLKQFKLYYIFMDKLEDVEEIHHWSKEEVVTDD